MIGLKVKVKLMILLKICLAYKSCTIGWRDTKRNKHVQYGNVKLSYQAQGNLSVRWYASQSVHWSVAIECFPYDSYTITISQIQTKIG